MCPSNVPSVGSSSSPGSEDTSVGQRQVLLTMGTQSRKHTAVVCTAKQQNYFISSAPLSQISLWIPAGL